MAKNANDKPVIKGLYGSVKEVVNDNPDYDMIIVCSTADVDRSGESINQDGWQLDNFKANPVFLAQHLHRTADATPTVIGSFYKIAVEGGVLLGYVKFADTELGREYKGLYQGRHMRAVSVGFMPMEGGMQTDPKSKNKIYVHTKQELYEVSAVAVPCNQHALRRDGYDWDGGHDGEGIKALMPAMIKELDERDQKLLAAIMDGLDEIKSLLPDNLSKELDEDDDAPADVDLAGDTADGGDKGFDDDDDFSPATQGAAESLLHEMGF